ncbi:MAG: hypothetical protein ACK4VO_05015 [Pseudobdellovibrio sp.]
MKIFALIATLIFTQSIYASELVAKRVEFSTGVKYFDINSKQYAVTDILENVAYFTGKASMSSLNCGEQIYFIEENNKLLLQIVRSNAITGDLESAVLNEPHILANSMVQNFSQSDNREFFSLTMWFNDNQAIRCRYTKTQKELNQK